MMTRMRALILSVSAALIAGPAAAIPGQPTPGALGLQEAATRIMERLHWFNGFLLAIITVITIFVTALLIWVMIRYNARSNKEPRKFSHNTLIEIVWTAVPVLILVVIALPSFTNLYYQEQEPDLETIAQMVGSDDPNIYPEAAALGWITVKAQGNQWNWTYSYVDELDEAGYPLEFVSNPLHLGQRDDPVGTVDAPTNLAVDYPLVIPVMRYIRYQTTASDVIHSWTVPAFGFKTDAVPGKLNQGWFLVERPGVYYGQCSELCGINHAYMPIEIRVVPQAQYDRWLDAMRSGDFDGARQLVATIEPLDGPTRLAAQN